MAAIQRGRCLVSDPSSTSKEKPARLPLWLLAGAAVLFLSGINPFHLPGSTDDIIYAELAKSWAAGGGHTFQGEVIADWPPMFPLLLSIPLRLGLDSLVFGKLLVVASALLALVLGYRLIQQERREFPLMMIVLMAVMPTPFIHTLRTASDWPFAALGFGFLLVLYSLRDRPGIGKAVFAGLLLAAAALTRQVGVLLGAAIVSQVIAKWLAVPKADRFRPGALCRLVWPEAVAAIIGAGVWLGWQFYLAGEATAGNLAAGNYDLEGSALWQYFEPVRFLSGIADCFFQFENLAGAAGIGDSIVANALLAGFGAVLLLGLIRTIVERRWQPSDAYVVATMLVVFPYRYKTARFWIVLTPFLLSWFVRGLGWIVQFGQKFFQPFGSLRNPAVVKAGFTLWIVGSLAIDTILLIRGNSSFHGGLSAAISRTPDTFFRGPYADLRQACLKIRSEKPDSAIGIEGWFANYTFHFTGGMRAVHWRFYPTANEFDLFIQTTEEKIPDEFASRFTPLFEQGSVVVHQRN